MQTPRIDFALKLLFVLAYLAASIGYIFHYANVNPQYDTQVIGYAWDFILTFGREDFWTYLFQVRKYPMGYVVPYGIGFKMLTLAMHEVTDTALFILGRCIAWMYGWGALLVVSRISRILYGKRDALWLLMTSVVFMLFITAIRPHIAATFWTSLSLLLAIESLRQPHAGKTAGSFVSAMMAFMSLQSGIFAFVFPAWAFWHWKKGGKIARTSWTAIVTVGAFCVAFACGYPSIVKDLVSAGVPLDPTLGGHGGEMTYSLSHGIGLIPQFVGSELFIVIFGLWWVERALSKRLRLDAPRWMMVVYLGLFFGVFYFHDLGSFRFFLPTIPVIAILGAEVLGASPAWVRRGMLVIMVLAWTKLAYLTVIPDTYQMTNSFLEGRTTGLIGTAGQPWYFFTIPEERTVHSEEEIPKVETIVMPNYSTQKLSPFSWVICSRASGSRTSDEVMLLWNETDYALFHIFETRALGPNLTIYCKNEVGAV